MPRLRTFARPQSSESNFAGSNEDNRETASGKRSILLGLLVEKDWLKHRAQGKRYLYRPALGREQSQRTALRRLLGTFFDGSTSDAMGALLDIFASNLTDEQFDRLIVMIEKARSENSNMQFAGEG